MKVLNMMRQRGIFYARCNSLVRNFSLWSPDEKVKLFKEFSCNMYCYHTWSKYKRATMVNSICRLKNCIFIQYNSKIIMIYNVWPSVGSHLLISEITQGCQGGISRISKIQDDMKQKPSKNVSHTKNPGCRLGNWTEVGRRGGAHDAHTPPPTPHTTTSQHHDKESCTQKTTLHSYNLCVNVDTHNHTIYTLHTTRDREFSKAITRSLCV